MTEPFDQNQMRQKLQEACEKVVREHQIAIDGLTEKQVAEAFKQAVLAGDFQVNVRAQPPIEMPVPVWNGTLDLSSPRTKFEVVHAQNVTYLPYRDQERLYSEITRLRALLDEHKIDWKKDTVRDENPPHEFNYFATFFEGSIQQYKQFPTEAETKAFMVEQNKNGVACGFLKIAK